VVQLADGRNVFVKAAVDELTADWLRAEYWVYSQIDAGFLPRLHASGGDELPILVLEDLSFASWPPPWTVERVDAVLGTLREVAATPPPEGLDALEDRREDLAGWTDVARDPAPFLGLGFVSPGWLEDALPALCAAEEACVLDGDALVHFDVRSDNICFLEGRTLLVDWNWAARGNPVLDVAAWLPSLAAEGGPRPEEILTGEPEAAALVSGYFAARAGLPAIPLAPRVRAVQREQIRAGLPWVARELGLPTPRISS
jgi:aminoglycoside phosphotransferase (APT) family kinase protein